MRPPPFTRMRMSTLENLCLPSSSTGSMTFHRSVSGCTSSSGAPFSRISPLPRLQ
jgi:hypothetical protein